jgi:serine/threonine protein phosphatase PrpC
MNSQPCPTCNTSNKPQARFCASCGQAMPVTSPLTQGLKQAKEIWESEPAQQVRAKANDFIRALSDKIETGVTRLIDSETGKVVGSEIGASLADVQSYWTSRQQRLTQPLPPDSKPTCLRCGEENRHSSRYCRFCAAPLAADAFPPSLSWQTALLSDVGQVRQNNEDIVRLWGSPDGRLWVALVADGMGGAASGEVASATAAETVEQFLQTAVFQPDWSGLRPGIVLPEALGQALRQVNERVYQKSQAVPEQAGMGTTATLALLQDSHLYLAQVGDSRAYLITAAGSLFQLTEDHTLVASLVAIGQLTAEEALNHPQRNLLYRCLGHEPNVLVDTFQVRLLPGDTLLLCSDGLTGHLNSDEITATIREGGEAAALAGRLVGMANERGGNDNISTALLVADQLRSSS